MNAEITTVIGQLSINQGQWRNEAPNHVAVREPKAADAPGAGKGDLFIITEIQGNVDNLEAMEQKLAQAIRDSYYLARGSITASLRRAVQAGSNLLYKRNKQVDVEKRVVGGVVVLAISNEDAFVAQIGPTAFFAVLGDHIKRYPSRSVWLDEALGPEAGQTASAMGLKPVIEPGLHHLRVAPEDMLVLADSRLVSQLPLKEVVRAVDGGNIKASVKKLGKAAQTSNGSALLLEVVEDTASGVGSLKISAPPQLSKLWSRPRKTAAKEEAPESDFDNEQEPVWEGAEEGESKAAAVFASTAAMMQRPLSWLGNFGSKPSNPETFTEREVSEPGEAPQYLPSAPEAGEWPDDAPAENEVAVTPVTETTYSTYKEDYDDYYDDAPSRSSGGWFTTMLLTVVAFVGGGLKRIFSLFVRGEDEPRQAGTQAQQPASAVPWKTLRNIAIIIPLLVVIVVSISYLQKGRLREAEYQEFVGAAQNKFEQAKSVDAASALALMSEAETSLLQAEQIKQGQPEIAELRLQMAEHVDTVGNVQRLYYLPQLRQYTDPGTDLQRIVVQGVEVYIMDSGNDRIFHHRLDDLGEALLADDETVLMTAKGQQVEDVTVGNLLSMTWMPAGGNRQTSDLVILNSTGLLEYNPNWGITTASLAGGNSLVMPAAVDSYFGNFYVLDPKANLLLRYVPTTDGYSAQPENYFTGDQTVNLSNAVDMSIDGAIYVLYQDGRISKFLSGQQVDFAVTGLDVPLKNPVAIYTAADEEVQHIYVADAGNQRIVQLNKDGSFVRQYKPRAGEVVTFGNLQDIYVDEIGGRLFALDSNNLYIGKLPAESPLPTTAEDTPPEVVPAEPEPAPAQQ